MTDSGDSERHRLFALREGQTISDKYLVQSLLGQGGMGVVHAALDIRIDRRVALKVLLPRLVTSPTASGRFMQEARASTRITSEHVVKLLDTLTLSDGTPVLVLEYLEGKDLRALLVEKGPLPPQQAVDYLLQALQAVAEGHMQSIIHRDLKPSNLFLTERADGTPLIKVLDFGIAKILQPSSAVDLALTSSEDIQLGSPVYMPPEQFTNPRDVDARADIWALGVTLYELISGKQPFQGPGYQDLVGRVLSAPPDSLARICPDTTLPAGLEGIILKCLEKSRDARYANAVELAVALAPFGSEDARLSLTRVWGLSRPRSPNPARPASDGAAFEATLPVSGGAPERALHTLSGASRVPRSTSRNRQWLGLAAASAIGVAATVAWRAQRFTPNVAAVIAPAVRPLASSLSALQVTPTSERLNVEDALHGAPPVAPSASASALPSGATAAPTAKTKPLPSQKKAEKHERLDDAPIPSAVSDDPLAQTARPAPADPATDDAMDALIRERH